MKTMLVHETDILRMTASKDLLTGATKMTRTKINTAAVPCYLSQKQSGTNTAQETGPNRIEYTAKVFFNFEADVKAGDLFILTLMGHTVKLQAGEPYLYRDHIEVPVRRSEAEA